MPIYATIAEALTLGTAKLAVDGVVVIGEHGKYPKNEKGQTLYPRYKFFKEVVKVFEAGGRSVPVFNDKHLSTDWRECVEMVEDSRRLRFPFHAGSSAGDAPPARHRPAVWNPLAESVARATAAWRYDFMASKPRNVCPSGERAGKQASGAWRPCAERRCGSAPPGVRPRSASSSQR